MSDLNRSNFSTELTADFMKTGSGRVAVLLLHGLTGMPSEMRPVTKHLQKLGFYVEVPLLPGHGGTHHELLATTWTDWLEASKKTVNRLLQQYDRVYVGGLSMGAILAALLAEDSRVSGLIMMSTTMQYDGELPNGDIVSKVLQMKIVQNFVEVVCLSLPIFSKNLYWTESAPYGLKDERLQKLITKSIEAAKRGESGEFGLFRTYLESFKQLNFLVRMLRKRATNIKCPALVLHSLEDTMTSIRNATEMYERLGSQDKSIVFITDSDHVMTLDLQKEQVARYVGDFISRVSATQSQNPCAVA